MFCWRFPKRALGCGETDWAKWGLTLWQTKGARRQTEKHCHLNKTFNWERTFRKAPLFLVDVVWLLILMPLFYFWQQIIATSDSKLFLLKLFLFLAIVSLLLGLLFLSGSNLIRTIFRSCVVALQITSILGWRHTTVTHIHRLCPDIEDPLQSRGHVIQCPGHVH